MLQEGQGCRYAVAALPLWYYFDLLGTVSHATQQHIQYNNPQFTWTKFFPHFPNLHKLH